VATTGTFPSTTSPWPQTTTPPLQLVPATPTTEAPPWGY
jgi:hypothetical protein